ncbi:hypothetical protein [Flavobacterium collinsii]|jgi:hypothetical protein|uniref:Uncharacterized protein n=1 Tax=Flavobacterium collinsii TaxID=1114861 RepID=A0A9W4X3H2_9FLAO|nr:hypothetical protein [Flavobacterium collinsii]CAI2767024.1 conserved protein of unknown function [Flavobacterium collinsii]
MIDQTELVNTIKLLIYKENPSLLEKVDFEDDNVFLEPLLFSFYKLKEDFGFSDHLLKEIIQGYFIFPEKIELEHSFSSQEIAYVPNVGYFRKSTEELIDPIIIIENTTIELLKHPVKLLENIFEKLVLLPNEEIIIDENIYAKNIKLLTNALSFIKENSHEQYKLIEECCKKILMFKTHPDSINSFATKSAHGIAFFNVYQEDYDEVFFVDDVAHQTGHIILTTILHDKNSVFKINENERVESIIGLEDHRDVYTLVHALYTYYTTLLCLDSCVTNNVFKNRQEHEALGRITFYLLKCTLDLDRLKLVIVNYGEINEVFTRLGIEIVEKIENKYFETLRKYKILLEDFDMKNQPYNFTYSQFAESNPIEDFYVKKNLQLYKFA